jgi:hypothetical protein
MLVQHATPARNLAGILRAGLLCSKSRGTPAVWFHPAARSAWAVLHTVRRHGGRIESVVILEVDVPRRWLRKAKGSCGIAPRTCRLTASAAPSRSPSSPPRRWRPDHRRPSPTLPSGLPAAQLCTFDVPSIPINVLGRE